jgi:cation diffusion facilitator CzcD-associated flavoprotein CzcO
MGGVKAIIALLFAVAAIGISPGRELRPANFDISFDPTAVLQSGTEIRFDIHVNDTLHKPVHGAQVTLQVETVDHQYTKMFKAAELQDGLYMVKTLFPVKGRWNVDVEARRDDQMTARTKEYYVPR